MTADGSVAGSAVVEDGAFTLTVWGDDLSTQDVIEGLTDGERFHFIHWSSKTGDEQTVELSFTDGPDNYVTNGISIVGNTTAGINPQTEVCCELQIIPNPFNNSTSIIFTISQDEPVSITIYDLFGRQVKYMQASYTSGVHQIEWSGDDAHGNQLSKGLYHVKMMAGAHILSRKAVMIR